MENRIVHLLHPLREQIINWRRDFHKHPEVGWTEFRTASIVTDILHNLGFRVYTGREVLNSESRMGVPELEVLKQAKEKAIQAGITTELIEKFEDGLTGVVGIWDTGRPGPTAAFRFDMDALPITESNRNDHLPVKNHFASQSKGNMHACGHDGHTAIGLGLATLISQMEQHLTGKVKLIFQPAEEGSRGAKAMVDAGVLDQVDYFFSGHLGLTASQNQMIVCGVTNFLASTKIDVDLAGIPAHAAHAPQAGKNALLAASTIALQVHGITRHGEGDSRINVGMLKAGEGRNIIPSHASLQLETRGSTNEINQFMVDQATQIIQGAAHMYGVEAKIEIVGQAISAPCDPELMEVVQKAAQQTEGVTEILPTLPFNASEDATYMMDVVQRQGGKATYMLYGTQLKAGHHHHLFDFDENSLPMAVELLGNILLRISAPGTP